MKSVKSGRSASVCELNCETTDGCLSMCGMCPSCAFAPKPPGSTQCLWRVSDEFKRRFVVGLVLRCQSSKVLERIQTMLSVTSWTLLTYARSRSPTSPQDYPRRSADPGQKKKKKRVEFLVVTTRVSNRCSTERDQDTDEDSEDPALTVVPGSSRSVSGVSRYRDFIGCLPVDLSKRILGLLDEHTLRSCQKVCQSWQHLAQETTEEVKFRRIFQDQVKAMMKRCRVNIVSPTYANIIEVPVPVMEEEKADVHSGVRKGEPFEAAYAKVKTKTVPMEERNVYCGAHFTTVLLDKEDPHRVVDYRGGTLMATGSKDRAVRLLYVASETNVVKVMKGHVGSIRAVLLCQHRDLVITASCDASIRCWSLKTDRCVMLLYGHTGTVNCLDVHEDRLVSGAKDCQAKVWSLHTGKQFEHFKFKHPSSVQCVKIGSRTVYSSCDRGLIKVWDMESASLLRVIDAHRSSVKCLFFDEWHFLSGDSNGQVMAWSVSCDTKHCLMTFSHPKEVKSLTLIHLRVVTGCVDGKIRIFNFLTGDCLRDITAEAETGRILSLHFHDNSILVNTKSCVKRFQFAKVFWDYTESAEEGQGDVSEESAASLGKLPVKSVGADRMAKVSSPTQKMQSCNKKPDRDELLCPILFPSTTAKSAQATERCAKESVMLSEKATRERMKRRGLHHPLTRDSLLLRVNAVQRAQRTDEVSVNMECNARLRDSWGPHTSQDPLHSRPQAQKQSQHAQTHPLWSTCEGQPRRAKTCVPVLKRAVSQIMTNVAQDRARRRAQLHSADTHRAIKTVSGLTAGATEGPRAPECRLMKSLPNPEYSMKSSTSLPRISGIWAAHSDPAGRLHPGQE